MIDGDAFAAPITIVCPDYTFDAMTGIKSATLSVTYWPDKADESGFARVMLTEQA